MLELPMLLIIDVSDLQPQSYMSFSAGKNDWIPQDVKRPKQELCLMLTLGKTTGQHLGKTFCLWCCIRIIPFYDSR